MVSHHSIFQFPTLSQHPRDHSLPLPEQWRAQKTRPGNRSQLPPKVSLPIVLSRHLRASKSSFIAKEVLSLLQLGLVWGEIRNNKIWMDKITNKITCPAGRVTFLTLWAMLMLPRSKRSEKPPPIIWRPIFGSAVKQMCLCVFCIPESGIMGMDSVPDFWLMCEIPNTRPPSAVWYINT